MVASWVSQASFSPPGITVAVAKDRAVEALLHKGDCFALNVLADGRESGLMKQEGVVVVSTVKVTELLASEPSVLALLAASVKVPLATEITPFVVLLVVGVKVAV